MSDGPMPATTDDDRGAWYAARPRPLPDHISATYWTALAEGRLLYQGCDACGTVQFYPRALCTGCGATPEWRESSGRGTVHTFTVIRQNGSPPFKEQTPYVVAMIDVEPGFRMMGNVFGTDVDDVTIGMPVAVRFARVDDDLVVPTWYAVEPPAAD